MVRASFLIASAALVLSGSDATGDVKVSVSPASFQKVDDNSFLQVEDHSADFLGGETDDSQSQRSEAIKTNLDRGFERAHESLKTEATSSSMSTQEQRAAAAMDQLRELSAGMAEMTKMTQQLRQEVQTLRAQEEAQTAGKQQATAQQDAELVAKIADAQMQTLTQKEMRVNSLLQVQNAFQQITNNKMQIYGTFASLNDELRSISADISSGEHTSEQEAEEMQFARLESQTERMLGWFNKLQGLKRSRDALRFEKNKAIVAAVRLGLSKEAILQELSKASSQ